MLVNWQGPRSGQVELEMKRQNKTKRVFFKTFSNLVFSVFFCWWCGWVFLGFFFEWLTIFKFVVGYSVAKPNISYPSSKPLSKVFMLIQSLICLLGWLLRTPTSSRCDSIFFFCGHLLKVLHQNNKAATAFGGYQTVSRQSLLSVLVSLIWFEQRTDKEMLSSPGKSCFCFSIWIISWLPVECLRASWVPSKTKQR